MGAAAEGFWKNTLLKVLLNHNLYILDLNQGL